MGLATSSSTRRMRGRIEETSASFEARSAPRSYPTRYACFARLNPWVNTEEIPIQYYRDQANRRREIARVSTINSWTSRIDFDRLADSLPRRLQPFTAGLVFSFAQPYLSVLLSSAWLRGHLLQEPTQRHAVVTRLHALPLAQVIPGFLIGGLGAGIRPRQRRQRSVARSQEEDAARRHVPRNETAPIL
jgi:hypothetical protein